VMVSTLSLRIVSSNRVLTDHEQFRSTTGGLTRVGPLPAHFTQQVFELDYPYPTLLTPSHSRMTIPRINRVLVRPGLGWCQRGGSNRTGCPVLTHMSIGTRMRGHRPWYLHSSHILTCQSNNPPEEYPRRRLTPNKHKHSQKKIRSQ